MFLILKTEHVKETLLGTEVHELHFFSMVDNFCRLVLKEFVNSTKTLQWSPLQPTVDSTAAIGGVHCSV